MKEIRKILLFLIGSALLGALITPWLYWGGEWLESKTQWKFLVDAGFHRYFDRAVLIAAALLLWPTYRSLNFRGMEELGIVRDPRRGAHVTVGFVSAAVCMAAFGGLLWYLGVFKLRGEPDWTALFKIALSAVTVALLEEWLFRGMILGFFRKALVDWAAVVSTSALFAIIHFLKPPSDDIGTVDWLSGFRALPMCFEKFTDPGLLAAGFTTLFVVGCVLGWGVLRTRSLWLSIGLHAGWVFTKFSYTKISRRKIKETMPWVGEDIIVGFGALAVVLCSFVLCWILLRYVTTRHREPRW